MNQTVAQQFIIIRKSGMSSLSTGIDLDSVVNDVIRLHPETTEVFNRFGIDACCGGASSIADAATRDDAEPTALPVALDEIIVGTSDGAGKTS